MPCVDELIDHLGGIKYISTLNLSRGYRQVPVDKSARAKTAFKTPYGLFQFKVMAFGIQGAPPTFQCMMDILLNDAVHCGLPRRRHIILRTGDIIYST